MQIYFPFLIVFLPFFVFWFLHVRSIQGLKRPDILTKSFFFDYGLMTAIPFCYMLYGDNYTAHYLLSQISNPDYIKIAAYSAAYFIIVFIFFYRIFMIFFKRTFQKDRTYVPINIYMFFLKCFTLVAFISFFALMLHFNSGVLSLFSQGNSAEIAARRAQLSQGRGILLSSTRVLVKSWVPGIAYLWFFLYLTHKRSFKTNDFIFLYSALFVGILASIWYLEKAVIFFYVFGFMGIWVYSGRCLKFRGLGYMTVLAVILIYCMYALTGFRQFVDFKAFKAIFLHRMTSQVAGAPLAFDLYSNVFGFRYLGGISRLLAELQGVSFQSVYGFVIDYYDPQNADVSGAVSSFVTGEAYGLFGIIGVIISPVVVSIYYSLFEASKFSSALSLIFVPMYGIFYSHFMLASSFYPFLWPVGFVYFLLPFLLLFLVSLAYSENRLTPMESTGRRHICT